MRWHPPETKGFRAFITRVAAVFALCESAGANLVIQPCDAGISIGSHSQIVDVLSVTHDPKSIRSGTPVTFIIGVAAMADPLILRNASADVMFCHRADDCMVVSSTFTVDNACSLLVHDKEAEEANAALVKATRDCTFQLGRRIQFNITVALPSHMFRGSYDVQIRLAAQDNAPGCWWFSGLMVVAGCRWTEALDYFAAVIGFITASASSYVLGQYFPKITGGLLPQITGFLLLGVVVGPYVTNFVSRFYVYLLQTTINRASLGFIALAAGAEIYLPHLTGLLTPIVCIVTGVTVTTFLLNVIVMAILMIYMKIPLLGPCPEHISLIVIMLMASIMAARSPSSAVAVVQELKVSSSPSAKVMIGVTVCSDLVVLVAFSVCTNLLSVEDNVPLAMLMFRIILNIMASVLYGIMWGLLIKLLLECWPPDDSGDEIQDDDVSLGRRIPDLPFVLLLKQHDWRLVVKGAVLFAMIFAMWEGRRLFEIIHVEIDPLMVPFSASCYVGHFAVLRGQLQAILRSWMPTVFLPFFTLTGASLNLGMVAGLFPWALLIGALRFIAIWAGSAVSAWATSRPSAEVRWMGITLISQAGISLGLALEVQSQFTWGRDFSSLVIAIVVINQLVGPVLCKIGMRKMVGIRGTLVHAMTHMRRCESDSSSVLTEPAYINSKLLSPLGYVTSYGFSETQLEADAEIEFLHGSAYSDTIIDGTNKGSFEVVRHLSVPVSRKVSQMKRNTAGVAESSRSLFEDNKDDARPLLR
eukprot:GEMP01015857.1.p1 GENE.GEMP01015857.1~~GEMP01015857.1.p1  ORF type:complete len:755 (+),score=130.31 GEMP01015857.1:399-2663(+)